MLTLILGPAKSGKTTRLLQAVRDCPLQGMARRIVIVPEQQSHQTERALSRLCGDGVSFTAEVLSFTRLCSRVSALYGGGARQALDRCGRILTARLALSAVGSRLRVFASATGRPEFLESVVSMMDEFKSYGVGAQALLDASGKAEGLFAQKLQELSVMLGAYDAVMAQGTCDPSDRLALLRDQLLDTDYAAERHFFVDGFTDFTGQELELLEALLRQSEAVTVALPWDGQESLLYAPGTETVLRLTRMAEALGQSVRREHTDWTRPLPDALTYLNRHLFSYDAPPFSGESVPISLVSASDRLDECRHCAAELRRRSMEGVRWREMAVAAGDVDGYGPLLEAVCQDCGIPIYTGTKTPVTAHPAAAFVFCALEAAVEGMDVETVTAYLRTGYSGVSDDDCDALENYAFTWAIRGGRWQTEWTEHPEGYDGRFTEETYAELAHLNECRRQAVGPLLALADGIRAAGNTRGQLLAIYRFLEDTALFRQIEAQVEALSAEGRWEEAQRTAQVWNALTECLQQTASVLGETAQSGGDLLRLLRTAMGQYELGAIPAVLDAVHFGSVDSIRGMEPRVLLLLGANEGSVPAVAPGGGLLTERERDILLHEMQIRLAPDSEGAMARQMLQIHSALTAPTEFLSVSYARSASGEQAQPSFLAGRLLRLFPALSLRELSQDPADAVTLEALTAMYLTAGADDGGARPAIEAAAEQVPALREALAASLTAAEPRALIVPEPLTARLFGAPAILTASRLDALGNCPLSFFLNYGLKARPRKEASFDAAEFGTFLHYILEQTVGELTQSQLSLPLAETDSRALVARHMTPYLETRMQDLTALSMRQSYLYRRNSQEAEQLLTEISQELAVSDFRPCAFELRFGDSGAQGPLTVRGSLGSGRLDGFVDRVDLWKSGMGDYFRVIDYKSGSKKFDYTELYGGVGMQLFLYLFALQRSGIAGVSDRPIPAGALYFPARRNILSMDGPAGPEQVARLRQQRGVKRTGLVLAETPVLEAMEHGIGGTYLPVQQKKSGLGDHAVTSEQMAQLEAFVHRRMAKAVDQIYAGQFAPAPFYRGASHDPCQWCDYADVCQKDPGFRRANYHAPVSAQDFWTKLGGEEDG